MICIIKNNFLDPEKRASYLTSLLAGLLLPAAFAPFDYYLVVFVSFALLFYLWSQASAKKAMIHGWLFGLASQAAGVSWIYYSLHKYGGSPVFLTVIIIILLAAVLGIFPAIAAYVSNRYFRTSNTIKLLWLYPVTWTLLEWSSGIVFTGFAWMQPGYTQIDTPLGAYAPLLGSHGITFLVVFTSAAFVAVCVDKKSWHKSLLPVMFIWLLGVGLNQVEWTKPVGESVRVSLIQGNIPQDIKWTPGMRVPTLNMYRDLSRQNKDSDLILWPETSIPDYSHRVVPYINGLRNEFNNQDVMFGIFIKDEDGRRLYNSLLNIHGGVYKKRHLVPLGEYVPFRFLIEFFNRWINIPMSDLAAYTEEQELLTVSGHKVGVTICFEDAFARDVLKDLPDANFLINVSNDAWFEDSHQPHQHHAIARMRAKETGRYMLRATNTGISSIINPYGIVDAVAPQFKQYVLTGNIQPMKGSTPYIVMGDNFILLLCMIIIVIVRIHEARQNRK